MFSIITALYKTDNYLAEYKNKLESFVAALKQENIPVEVVLVPREPSVFERSLINELTSHDWCREVSSESKGLYGAWNSGVSAAKGEILGFWNVDDFRYMEGVKEGLDLITQGADLVYFPFRIRRYLNLFGYSLLVHIQRIDSQVPEFNEQTKTEFLRSMLCGPFFIFKKSLYDRVGPFDEQFRSAADFDWCIRAAKIGQFKRGQKLGGSFRVDGKGISSGGKDFLTAENNTICLRHHIKDKIKTINPELMKPYDPANITYRGEKIVLNQNGLLK